MDESKYPVFLKRKIPQLIGERKYSNEFSRIELIQQVTSDPIKFIGPGSLYQNEDKRLLLKIYHNYSEDDRERHLDLGGPVGRFYGEEHMFRLQATDMDGIQWTAKNIWVSKDAKFPSIGVVIEIEIDEIETEREVKRKETFNIEISAFGKYRTPATEFVKLPEGSISRVKNTVKTPDYEINTVQTSELLFVTIVGNRISYKDELIDLVLEALGIINGKRLSVATKTIALDGKEKIYLVGNGESKMKSISPPIPAVSPMDSINFTEFIQKYLEKMTSPWSVLYMNWFKICDTSNNNLDNVALIQSTVVEGVLKEYYKQHGIPQGVEIAEINKFVELASQSKLDPEMISRVKGMIENMKVQNARRALKELSEAKVINGKMVKAWNKQRNSLAHGKIMSAGGREVMQVAFDNSNCVLALFYILLLRHINYSQKAIDYSSENWPSIFIDKISESEENTAHEKE